MKIKIIVGCIIVFGILAGVAAAVEPVLEWEKTFGGRGDDTGYFIKQTSDGGYAIAGDSLSFKPPREAIALKINDIGKKIFYTNLEGRRGYFITETDDGGYIVAGTTMSSIGGRDAFLSKLNKRGKTVWMKTYGGSKDEIVISAQETSDGYILAGSTNDTGSDEDFDFLLIKTDKSGTLSWKHSFGLTGSIEYGYSVIQDSDGYYVVTGITDVPIKLYVVKVSPTGSKIWDYVYGENDVGFGVQENLEGDYLIAGTTYNNIYGGSDVFILQIDSDGLNPVESYFGSSDDDIVRSFTKTSDGGYIVFGTKSVSGVGDMYLLKLDIAINKEWATTFGGSGDDRGYYAQQTTDGGYIMVGSSNSFSDNYDIYIVKAGDTTII